MTDPIDSNRADPRPDWLEVQALHFRFGRALDTNDWMLYRSCLSDTVTAHYEGADLPEVTVPADDWTAFVAAAVTPQTTVHYFTNLVVDSWEDRASGGLQNSGEAHAVRCRFNHQSCHRVETGGAGDSTLIQFGTYETLVVGGLGSRRIRRIHHRVAWSTGNPALVDTATASFQQAYQRVFGS